MNEMKVFDEEVMKILIDDCKGSINEILRVVKWMRRRFGQKAFVPNLIPNSDHSPLTPNIQ